MNPHPKAKAAGITPDIWKVQIEDVSPRCNAEILTVVSDSFDIVSAYTGIRNPADADLIVDAGNTMNTHGHTPSQMVEIIRELRTDLYRIMDLSSQRPDIWDIADNLLTKTEDFA